MTAGLFPKISVPAGSMQHPDAGASPCRLWGMIEPPCNSDQFWTTGRYLCLHIDAYWNYRSGKSVKDLGEQLGWNTDAAVSYFNGYLFRAFSEQMHADGAALRSELGIGQRL